MGCIKKRILIVDYQFCLGGVGIAVLNLIENIKEEFDVELLLIRKGGELENRLPMGIKIHYVDEEISDFFMSRKEYIKTHSHFKEKLKRSYWGLLGKFNLAQRKVRKLAELSMKSLGHFDVVINNDMDSGKNCLGGLCHPLSFYGVDAEKKFLIIHGDFVANRYDRNFFLKEYMKYDKIISVSESLNNQMKILFPKFAQKFYALKNFQDVKGIKELATRENISFDRSKLNIVSASRLVELKGYMRTLKVIKKFVDEGIHDFVWHILGDGVQRQEILEFISKNKLENYVKLYGVKNNPYPYFKNADLVMLNSYHESYGLVLVESLILGTPVFTTNTISAKEIVGNNGWVVDNDEKGIYNGLKEVFDSSHKIESLKKALQNYSYDNESILSRFKELI